MISILRRYRWWLLLLVAMAGLASWFLWPNAMRKRYERIQLGMTRAEVKEMMGRSPMRESEIDKSDLYTANPPWKTVAIASLYPWTPTGEPQTWCDGCAAIFVIYENDRAIKKYMTVPVPYWEQELRKWFHRHGFSIW